MRRCGSGRPGFRREQAGLQHQATGQKPVVRASNRLRSRRLLSANSLGHRGLAPAGPGAVLLLKMLFVGFNADGLAQSGGGSFHPPVASRAAAARWRRSRANCSRPVQRERLCASSRKGRRGGARLDLRGDGRTPGIPSGSCWPDGWRHAAGAATSHGIKPRRVVAACDPWLPPSSNGREPPRSAVPAD